VIGCTFTLGLDNEPDPRQYTVLQGQAPEADGFVKVLTFSYSQSASDKGGTEGLRWGNLGCTYTVNSDVYFLNNQIQVNTSANAFIHINFEGAVTEGNFAGYSATNTFTIGIDSTGKLVVSTPGPQVTDNSQTPDINVWSKIVGHGTVVNVINAEKDYLRGCLNSFLAQFNSEIQTVLNSPADWIFPGGNTFTFETVAFSSNQDLVSHITYVQPGYTLRWSVSVDVASHLEGNGFRWRRLTRCPITIPRARGER